MAEFALPSGRVVEMCEPSCGDELEVVASGASSPKELLLAKCAVIVPSLSRREILNMNRKDGRALFKEVGRIWNEE